MKLHLFLAGLVIFAMATCTFAQEKKVEKSKPKWAIWVVANFTWDDSDSLFNSTSQRVESNDVNHQFALKHARLIINGKGAKDWGYHLMGEFRGADSKPAFMQAWVYYQPYKYLRLRAGQFKYPLGGEAYPSLMIWKFVNPSYVTGGVVKKLGRSGDLFRDIGVEVAGKYPISGDPKGTNLLYKLMVMNGTGANANENNNAKDFVLFAGAKLAMNITLAGSFYTGKSGQTDDELSESAFGIQFLLREKKYTAQAEYIAATYETAKDDIKPAGYYFYGTYMIKPSFEIGARYDAFESNTEADNTGKSRISLSTGYYFNKINRLLLNYEIRDDDKNDDLGNLLTIQLYAAF